MGTVGVGVISWPAWRGRLKASSWSLLSDSIKLMSVTAVCQVLFLLLMPILTRRHTPAEFGSLGFFNAVLSTMLPIACFRMDYAIPVVEDADLGNALGAAALLCLCFGVLVAAILVGFSLAPGFALSKSILEFRFQILGSACFLGLGQIAVFLATRKKQFVFVGILKGGVNTIFALAAILPFMGLIPAQILSYAICIFIFVGNVGFFARQKFQLQLYWKHIKKFKSHIIINFPTAILDTLSMSAPVMVMSMYYSAQYVGFYTQIQRLGCGLIILASSAIGQVFFQQSSTAFREGRSLNRLVWKTFGILTLIASVNGLLLWVGGSWFFRAYMGKGWRTDTYFILLANLPTLMRMVVSPLSFIFFATGKLKRFGAWQVAHFALSFGLLPMVARHNIQTGFLAWYFLLECVAYGSYFWIICSVARASRPRLSSE